MKLTVAQTIVFGAIGAMMLLLLGDIADIINIPLGVFLAAVMPLAITAHRVLPSLDELERHGRRA